MFRKVIVRRAGAKGWARGGKRRGKGLGNTSSQITYYFSFTTGQKAKYQLNFSEQQQKNRCINLCSIPPLACLPFAVCEVVVWV